MPEIMNSKGEQGMANSLYGGLYWRSSKERAEAVRNFIANNEALKYYFGNNYEFMTEEDGVYHLKFFRKLYKCAKMKTCFPPFFERFSDLCFFVAYRCADEFGYFHVYKGRVDDDGEGALVKRNVCVDEQCPEAEAVRNANDLWKEGLDFWRVCLAYYPYEFRTKEICLKALDTGVKSYNPGNGDYYDPVVYDAFDPDEVPAEFWLDSAFWQAVEKKRGPELMARVEAEQERKETLAILLGMTSKAVQNTLAKMDPEKLWLEEDKKEE
jgi:hypothetical protein